MQYKAHKTSDFAYSLSFLNQFRREKEENKWKSKNADAKYGSHTDNAYILISLTKIFMEIAR